MAQEDITKIGPGRNFGVETLKNQVLSIRTWSPLMQLYLVSLVSIAAPILWLAGRSWLNDENQAHGIFIIPLSLFLLWIQRDAIQKAVPNPTAWGLIPLGLGLFLHLSSWLLQMQTRFLSIWALTLILFGSILILHGRELWKIARFPVLFLLMGGGIPERVTALLSNSLQYLSSSGATMIMVFLGFPIIQQGNIIEIPGYRLEVAEACSGLKKVVALFAFSLIYGYLFQISLWKRILLVIATVPIAILANVIRVCGLVAIAQFWGLNALHFAHDYADIVVLVIAFFCFVGVGKVIGCKNLRFSL